MFIEDGTVMTTDEMMTSIKSAYGKDSSCMIVITKDALHDFLMDRVIILKRVSANKHQKMCEGNLSYVENNSGMYYITIDGAYVYGGEHMVVLPHISNTKKKRGAYKCASRRDRKRRSKATRRRQLG